MSFALAIKTGKVSGRKAGKAVRRMAAGMTERQLRDFAEKKAYMRSLQKKEDDLALVSYLRYLDRIGA